MVDDGSVSGITPHSGTYTADLGTSGSRGYLSQSLSTPAGQLYSLSISFWVNNVYGDPNVLLVSWNGTNIFGQTNLVATGWINIQTNISFVSPSSGTSVLQFGFEDDYGVFALDDISIGTATNAPSSAGGVACADSGAFLLDTTGILVGGGVACADSGAFLLDTTGTLFGGGVACADSGAFLLDTTGTLFGGGVACADSGAFLLDTTGILFGGGVACADSGGFTLDSTGLLDIGGVACADSGAFTLDTTGILNVGPTLTITFSGNSVVVSWPLAPAGFVLQRNSSVTNSAGWSAYGGTVEHHQRRQQHHAHLADGETVLPPVPSIEPTRC